MNQDTLASTGRALLDALHSHDLSVWEASLAPGFVADYPCAPGLGREAARAYNAPFIAAFPDLKVTTERTVVQGNTVIVECFIGGTFTRPLETPKGTVPPNGRSGGVRVVLISELEGGKIVRERTVWNQLDLFSQLGIMSALSA